MVRLGMVDVVDTGEHTSMRIHIGLGCARAMELQGMEIVAG